MVVVRGGGEDVIALKHNFSFFSEMQTSIVNIFKQIGFFACRNDLTQNNLRSIYIDTSKVLYIFREKEINEGNYAFTAQEDRLFYNFYKMIGYTRSIKHGLGQRDQTYAMIMAWWNYYPECAYDAIKHLVSESSFGFWGDIKHFCYFVDKYWNEFNTDDCWNYKNRENYFNPDNTHPLIKYAVELLAKQLQNDIRILCFDEHDNKDISNAAKWVPQEKSKSFGWIYKMLAITYKKNIYSNSSFNVSFLDMTKRDLNDIFGKFRKNIVSQLNKFLDPPQIKQCSNDWHEIDFSNVTQQTCKKYFNSFANLTVNKYTYDKHTRCPYNIHRIKCRENFMNHQEKIIRDKFDIFNGCRNVKLPINEDTTDYEMLNLVVSRAKSCIPDTNKYTVIYGMRENIKNKKFVKQFKKHWYRNNNYDNLKDAILVLDLDCDDLEEIGKPSNSPLHHIMLFLSIAARVIENMDYKKGCYLYFTNNGVTVWFDASNYESIFDIIQGIIELYNKTNISFKTQNVNDIEHAFSMENIYQDIYDNISHKRVPDNNYNLLFLSTNSFVDSAIELKNDFPSKHYRNYEYEMQKIRKMYAEQNFEVPKILYWNLHNAIDWGEYDRTKLYSTEDILIQCIINSMRPKIKTSENTDRGQNNHKSHDVPLFIRPEISQVLYNVIEDHMSSRDINVLNAFINNFYMNGIDGMKKFDMNFAFQYLMENEHYNGMDIRFI